VSQGMYFGVPSANGVLKLDYDNYKWIKKSSFQNCRLFFSSHSLFYNRSPCKQLKLWDFLKLVKLFYHLKIYLLS
jgi:hypothetical protein